jgi:hypothetical protein
MQTKAIFSGRFEPRILTDAEMRDAVARGRQMQARAMIGYFSAIRGRFGRNLQRRTAP